MWALAVILPLATMVFVLAAAPARTLMPTAGTFPLRRNLWFGITLTAFLAHNFWIFVLLAGTLLSVASSKDEDKVGLALFVFMAVPTLSAAIPAFGTGKIIFEINFVRLIALVVLLPAFIREVSVKSWSHFSGELPDKLLLAFLGLNVGLLFVAGSLTGTIRGAFGFLVDVFLPYAVASRLTTSPQLLRTALASYVVGAMVLAALGIFEFAKSWALYSFVPDALGVHWDHGLGDYLYREGRLRAMGTAGQTIPFGYSMAVGICLLLGLRRGFRHWTVWIGGLGLLAVAMICSLSRGPWIGATAGFLVFIMTGPRKWGNLIRLAAVCAVGLPLLLASPAGDTVVSFLPFSPTDVDEGSYTYRALLLEVAADQILSNPLFGAYDYVYSPQFEQLRQGQGIIDIVNTYLGIALTSGLTGLSLFVGVFVAAIIGVGRRMKSVPDKHGEIHDLGRALLAALTCILVTIFSVSSITFIPVIYYFMAGLAVAYARGVRWGDLESGLVPAATR